MFIYWFFWFIFSFFSFLNKSYSVEIKYIYYIFVFFLFLFVGFRFEVGADWYNYLEIYNIYLNEKSFYSVFMTDPAYGFLNYLSSAFGFESIIFINAVCALIFILCLCIFSRNFKNPWPVLFVLYPVFILVVSMGYTRQSVAASLSLLFFSRLFSSEKKFSALYLILAFLFHKTAIILILFYPILFLNKSKLINFFYCLFVILSLSMIVYFSVGSNQYLLIDGDMQSSGFFLRAIFYLFPFLLYVFYLRSKINNSHRTYCDFFIFLLFFLILLGFFFSTLSDRFMVYLVFFNVFIIVRSLELMKKDFNFIVTLVLFVFYTSYMYLWFNFGTWSDAWIPYSNYLLDNVL